MDTLTANEAKQNFGALIDKALQGPVSITKHGRPAVIVTSDSEYREYLEMKYARLKSELKIGFDVLENGQTSAKSIDEIAASVIRSEA